MMAKKKAQQGARKNTIQPSPKKPRLDPVQRLLYRFYEPLLLLHTLGPTTGEHSQPTDSTHAIPQSRQALRRRFLDDLAYFCDYEKGGDTVTALAIESRPQGPIFWLASNAKSGSKVKGFLTEVLNDLGQISSLNDVDQVRPTVKLVNKAITFGTRRIKKYCSLLKPLLLRASKVLALRGSAKGE